MVDYVYLADTEAPACEIVEFIIEAETERDYAGGIMHSLYLRNSVDTSRFDQGRLYIAYTSSGTVNPPNHRQVGFYGEFLTIVNRDKEEIAKTGIPDPTANISDGGLRGGFFFPTRDLANDACLIAASNPNQSG